MKLNTVILLGCLFVGLRSIAQEKEKKYVISQFLVEAGALQHGGSKISRSDLHQFSNQSQIIRNLENLGDIMTEQGIYNSAAASSIQFHVLSDKKKKGLFQQRLKIGLGHYNYNLNSNSFLYTSTGRYDTITSSQTGEQRYIDTTYIRTISAFNSSKMTALQLGYEWHYQAEKRWHWFLAVNTAFGISTSQRLDLTEFAYNQNYEGINSSNFGLISETIQLSPSTMQKINGQLGLDFRLGKKDNFLGKSFLRLTGSYALCAFQSDLLKNSVQAGFGYTLGYGFNFSSLNSAK